MLGDEVSGPASAKYPHVSSDMNMTSMKPSLINNCIEIPPENVSIDDKYNKCFRLSKKACQRLHEKKRSKKVG